VATDRALRKPKAKSKGSLNPTSSRLSPQVIHQWPQVEEGKFDAFVFRDYLAAVSG
jgi:hypothetical protein